MFDFYGFLQQIVDKELSITKQFNQQAEKLAWWVGSLCCDSHKSPTDYLATLYATLSQTLWKLEFVLSDTDCIVENVIKKMVFLND